MVPANGVGGEENAAHGQTMFGGQRHVNKVYNPSVEENIMSKATPGETAVAAEN